MKKLIVLTVLVLAVGCSANPRMTNKHSAAGYTQTKTPVIIPTSNKMLSSSIATHLAGKPSVTMKGTLDITPIRTDQQSGADKNASAGEFDQQVLQLVNAERAKSSLQPLSMDAPLSKVALVKAQDMINNNYFDHNSPTYGSPFDLMKQNQISYKAAGENIAKGQPTPEQVMHDWMNSPGHKANILSTNFTKIGIAYYKGAWVEEFTG